MNLVDWAHAWGVSAEAVLDLQRRMGTAHDCPQPLPEAGTSEAAASVNIRLDASQNGARLWRNNVGACMTDSGTFLRFGLANETAAMNAVVKSGDLIGIRPVLVTPAHVGHVIGQFISREAKRPGWKFDARNEREAAQLRWASLIVSMGGDAQFSTGKGSF
jgi:hypothetical protein